MQQKGIRGILVTINIYVTALPATGEWFQIDIYKKNEMKSTYEDRCMKISSTDTIERYKTIKCVIEYIEQ